MRGTVKKALTGFLAVLVLTLVIFGLVQASGGFTAASAATPNLPARTEQTFALLAQQPENDTCLACHGQENQTFEFPNGDVVSITVHPEVYNESKHASLACTACHTDITDFPHPEVTAQSAREYTLQYADTCAQCHSDQATDIMDSAHAMLPPAADNNSPTCSNCHDPHSQPDVQTDENGDPLPVERVNIANTCSTCHAAIVDEYKNSVHGAALFEEGNLDVPACNDCHGIHNISQISTEFRLNSPRMCGECHTRPEIMDKYGISTDVMDTYVADFHGTTVTLFEPEHTGDDTNKPVCYDCHGVHNIVSADDPEKGLSVKANMLASCQRCHPDATENFTDTWMSHYIASPTRFPIVYYVQLFYKFFIPIVLGGMGLFVLSDILHRLGITGRKHAADQTDQGKKE